MNFKKTTSNYFLILISILFYTNVNFGQKSNDITAIIPENVFESDSLVNLFVVGESHVDVNIDVNLALLFYLNKTQGVNKLGIEFPFGFTKYFNEFLFEDDETIFTLLKKEDRLIYKDTKRILTLIKQYNSEYSKDNPISVFGFDYASNNPKTQQLLLNLLFSETDSIKKLTQFCNFVSSEYYSDNLYELAIQVKALKVDLIKNRASYQTILKDKFLLYEKVVESLIIRFDPIFTGTLEQFKIREKFIVNVISDEIQKQEKAMIICGYAHGSKKVNDEYFFEDEFTSFSAEIGEQNKLKVYTIYEHYYLTKIASKLFKTDNLLSVPIESIVLSNKKCTFINGENLDIHPLVQERFDMTIIHNQRVKYKLKL